MRSMFQFNPNQPLGRLSIIWGYFRSFLFIFRFLVCILPVLPFWNSPQCLQEYDRQGAQQSNDNPIAPNGRLGVKAKTRTPSCLSSPPNVAFGKFKVFSLLVLR